MCIETNLEFSALVSSAMIKLLFFFQIHFETALSTQARRIWKQFIKARTAQMAINLVQSLKKQKTIFVKERDKATVCFGFFK